MQLAPIPQVKERLSCFHSKQKFPLKIIEMKKDIRNIAKATKAMHNNEKVMKILEVYSIHNAHNISSF